MKLTKYGFHLNLLGFSSFLSVLGIIVSIIGAIAGIGFIWLATVISIYNPKPGPFVAPNTFDPYFYVSFGFGVVLLLFMTPYLVMWILLKKKTSKQNIPGIEKIGKVYSYVSGSLEIIAEITLIIFAFRILLTPFGELVIGQIIGLIIGLAIHLIFACLKIHGIRVENNKLLGTYLGLRYALFILDMVTFIVCGTTYEAEDLVFALITVIVYFILDIGLIIILHSIRVDREKNTERPETVQFVNLNYQNQ